MRKTWGAFSLILVLLILTVPLFAKGDTVRITIAGSAFAAPIVITDPAVLARFEVWSGSGTGSNQTNGLNIDWSRTVAELPKDLKLYIVSFVTTRSNPSTYTVRYAVDPATRQGYVYIPGKADPEYRDNVWLVYRGIEGNWFHASKEWEQLANPLIAKAERSR